MKRVLIFVVLMVGCIEVAWGQVPMAIPCSGCTRHDMKFAAKYKGPGSHYVTNYKKGEITLWHVYINRVNGRRLLYVSEAEVSSPVRELWQRFVRLGSAAGTTRTHFTMSYKDLVPSDQSLITNNKSNGLHASAIYHNNDYTAWNVIDPGNRRHTVFLKEVKKTIISKGSILWGKYMTSAEMTLTKAILDNKTLGFPKFSLNDTIIMKDGSRIDVTWDVSKQSFETVPGTAYDSQGNRIPDYRYDVSNGKNGQAEYIYSDNSSGHSAYNQFKSRIGRWGIEITGFSGWHDPVVFACTYTKGIGEHCVEVR